MGGRGSSSGLRDMIVPQSRKQRRSQTELFKDFEIIDFATGETYRVADAPGSVRNRTVFAGKGSKSPYRDAYKLVNKYGGSLQDWQHVKADILLETEDGYLWADVHWSQCEGIGRVDPFVKEWKEE